MHKFLNSLFVSLCTISFTQVHADDSSSVFPEMLPEISFSAPLPAFPQASEPSSATKNSQRSNEQKYETLFSPFTGKIKGKRVRLRLRPDLDSRIIKELGSNDLVSVVGEKGDFWAIEPPAHFKAYVFRSFVLDNVIEGNHVNVRLEPSLEAPVIGHLNAGDRVDPLIAATNNKWYEISPPSNCHFYIAKEFVSFAGGPEVKKQADKRQETGEELLETTSFLAKSELRKPFEEIDFNRVLHSYNTVIKDFDEFAELSEQAKEELASFQEAYLQKRIAHLETLPKEQLATESKKQQQELQSITDRMKIWEPVEEALYLSWASCNESKDIDAFYEEQRLACETVTGIIDAYASPVKNKPGDFVLRDADLPIAYLYSTQVNLNSLVGKRAKLIVASRPNNNFAFPAYYVLGVE